MSRFMLNIMDSLSESGWTARPKNAGFLVVPPVARPGHESLYIEDPGGDSGRQKIIMSKLRQAGFKPPEEKSVQKTNGSHSPAIAETSFSSPYVRLRARVGEALNALSEVEKAISEIEQESSQAQEKLAGLRKLGLLV